MISYKELRDIRAHYKLTQHKMAAILHVSRRTYQHYEAGTSPFPEALAELLQYKLTGWVKP